MLGDASSPSGARRSKAMADKSSTEELRRLAPDLAPSIAKLTCPAYILDRSGTVRWINAAGIAQFGDLRGRDIGQIVDREFATLARQEFAAKVLGTVEATEATVVVRTRGRSPRLGRHQLGAVAPRRRDHRGVRARRPNAGTHAGAGETPPDAEADDRPSSVGSREVNRGHCGGAGHLDRDRAESRPGHHCPLGCPQPPRGGDQSARARPRSNWPELTHLCH